MPTRPPNARAAQSRQAAKTYERFRGSAQARGYDARWVRASNHHRRQNPLCRYCEVGAFGPPIITAASLVDHLYPHKGDQDLFWDRRWWVSACTTCHSGPKQALEARGKESLDRLAAKLGLPDEG